MCLHSKFAPGQDTPQWYTDGNDASTTRYGGGAVNVDDCLRFNGCNVMVHGAN